MSELIEILKLIKAGESKFLPIDNSHDSLIKFQTIGKALSYALKEGLLDRCEFKKESYGGDLYYSEAFIIGGLTYKGEELLVKESTFKGRASKYFPSVIQWISGILAGIVLSSLLYWLGLAP